MSGKSHYAPRKRGSSAVTTSRTGGQANTVAVLLFAAAGVAWFWWRKKKADEEQQGLNKKQAHRGKGSLGSRSAFKFSGVRSSNRINANSGKQAFAFPAAAANAGGARKGNPKKANKKQRREEKAAKKESKGKGLELIHNAQLNTKEEEGPVTIKYVDMSKTSDIYDKVREYQETGKKRYP